MDSPRVALRFGILAKGRVFPAWAVECTERLIASGHAELTTIIDVGPSPLSTPHRSGGALLPRLYAEYWLERRARSLRRVDVSERWSSLDVVRLSSESTDDSGARARDTIAECRLDFVLCLDAIEVPEALENSTRFGVWSFCQDRRAAPCFREVMEGHTKTRIALERLGADGVVCLYEGYFATCQASWVNNLDRARLGAVDFCVRVCAEIAHGGAERLFSRPRTAPAREPLPRNRDVARLLLASATRSVEKLWELLFHVEIWNVGFTTQSVAQILNEARVDAPRVTWCKPHAPKHFIADPFPYVRDGQERVLVEDYDQIKGKICSIDPSNGRALELAVDLEFPYHLSYPCVFEEDGETYCIPEAYQSNRASLYRRTEQGWSFVRDLIQGLPIVDPTLFKHDGRYWLLFTLQNDGAWGNQKLYAYHASALDAAWVPHALNPIKCDIGTTRPAGNVFRVAGQLFRPSQDCSSTYGAAVVINEIVELTATAFEERVAARIDPIADGPYPDGLHTLNAMGDHAVFDSKKFAFDWFAWRKNWGRLHEVLR